MPTAFLRRKFLPFLAVIPMSFVVMPLVGLPITVSSSVQNLIFVGALLGLGYALALRSVWVSVSSYGVHGQGATGRKVDISWHEPLRLERAVRSTVSGVLLSSASGKASVLTKVFVPDPIVSSVAFQAAMARWAPSGHVLRGYVSPGS